MRSKLASYYLGLLLGAIIGVGLSLSGAARAVNTPSSATGSASYVTPAFSAPMAPQVTGQDGGLSGQCVVTTGRCVRLFSSGTWGYLVAAIADGGGTAPYNVLLDSSYENFCLNNAQSVITFTGFDGGQIYCSGRAP